MASGILSTGTGTEGSLLIARTIFGQLIEEFDKFLLPRDLAALVFGPAQIPGSSIDVNTEDVDTTDVRLIAEGAEIWLDTPTFTNVNLKPLKFGLRINITAEMMEDSMFPLLQRSAAIAGRRLAENETNIILTALDTSSNDVVGGATLTLGNITSAMRNLEDVDAQPTDMLIGPEALSDLRQIDTLTEVDKAGNRTVMDTGKLPTIFGMRIHRFSRQAAPSVTHSKYAYVIDRQFSYIIAEKRAVSMKFYTLETHDIEGVAVTQRITVALLRSAATSRITTT